MNDNLNIFEQALDKLKFRDPVPAEARRFALYNKRRLLKETLNSFGDYSFLYGLTLRIYFFTKRLGISLSVLQSRIVLLIITAIAGGALYSAAIFASGILQKDMSLFDKKPATPDFYKTEQIKKPPAEQYPAKKENDIKFRVGIEKFSGDGIDNTILNNITDKLALDLTKLKGTDKVINLRKGRKNKHINLLMSGSIEKLGGTFIITTKIIDIEKSEVLFVSSEETKNIDRIDTVISNIARKTADQFK